MKLDPFPRLPADPSQRERKLVDLFRDIAAQVNPLTEGRVVAVTNAATAAPTTGTHAQGDIVRNSAPTEIGDAPYTYVVLGWVCTVGGTPGTWEPINAATDSYGAKLLHGWPLDANGDRQVTLAYDAGTRKVTITAASGDTFDLWVLGEKFVVDSPHVSEAHSAVAGGWFYYHDGVDWTWSQNAWDMTLVATTCYVYWSTVASSGVALTELHCAERDSQWHKLEHSARGTALIGGGVLGDYSIGADVDTALQFSITECTISDEDIRSVLAAKADGGGFTIWRRSGTAGVWTWSTSENLPFLFSTYPQRNYDAGGGTGWTMADIDGSALGQWVTAYVLAVPSLDSAHRFIIVPGQTAYTSLALAQQEQISDLVLGELPWTESCPIAQLVFHGKSTYGNASNSVLAAVTRLIGNRVSITGAAAASNHNSLSGLQGGAAGEYYHLDATDYTALSGTRTTKGIDTVDDVIVDSATTGLVLKDGASQYWRITVTTAGALVTTSLGGSKP